MVESSARVSIRVLVSCFLALSALQAQPERPQFGNLVLDSGYRPAGLALADFDGDGMLDVAAAEDTGICDFAIFLGTHGDYLSPPVLYPSGTCFCLRIATGDFNSDGKLDLAQACEDDEFDLTVSLGNGDGTFGAPDVYSVTPGDDPRPIVVGEFTGDSFDDVILADNGSGGLWLVPGNGDGTLGGVTLVLSGAWLHSLAAGDLNGDTHLDLVGAHLISGLKVFLSDGIGGFAPPVDYDSGGELTLADLDDDGDLDLATAPWSSPVSVLVNNGDGSFQPAVSYPILGAVQHQITAADFDNDGIPDLAAVGAPTTVFHGIGDGTFVPGEGYPWGTRVRTLHAADLNDDGKMDLFGSDGPGIHVLLGNGDGTFLNRVFELEWESDFSTNEETDFVDLDLDGSKDLVILDGEVYLLYGRSDGSFEPGVSVSSLPGTDAVVVADFGLTGATDLAFLADPSSPGPAAKALWILYGQGPRTYVPGVLEGPPVSDNPTTLTAADLDGDGEMDVLVTDEIAGELIVIMGLGNGQFVSPPLTYPVGSAPVAAALERIDADAHLDLLVVNRDSDNVAVLRGNGDGTFQPATFVGTGQSPSSIHLADLDADGFLDLVVTNLPPFGEIQDVTVRLGNGDGTFGTDQRFVGGVYSRDALLGDLDRDGHLDIVLGGFSWFRGHGDGTFEPEPQSRHRSDLGLVGGHLRAAEDLDDDGWVDIVAGDEVFINQGGPGMVGFEPDGETLRWPGVVEADSYNLYRGDTSAFIDVDTDGLPDGGYGVCLSGADPDPTDTIFSDPDVPITGGDGFFYIRSVVSVGGEDLGSTSGGLVRVPGVFCP